jgi:hypothetical protein
MILLSKVFSSPMILCVLLNIISTIPQALGITLFELATRGKNHPFRNIEKTGRFDGLLSDGNRDVFMRLLQKDEDEPVPFFFASRVSEEAWIKYFKVFTKE